jgi:hypothetical protein
MALKDDLLPLLQTDVDVRTAVREIMLEALNNDAPIQAAVRTAVQSGTAQAVNLTPATVTAFLLVKFQDARTIRNTQGQQAYVEYLVNNMTGPEQRAFAIWFPDHP